MSNAASRPVTGQTTGIHPVVFEIAIGAVLWFLVVVWTAFAGKGGIDFYLTIVTLFCAIFVSLFVLVASFTTGDSRWSGRQRSFRAFLDSDVGIGSETMRGRDVLIEIALVPVVLAFCRAPYRSCLDDFRLRLAARSSSSPFEAANPSLTHSASSLRRSAPSAGPSAKPSAAISDPLSGKIGTSQRSARVSAVRQRSSLGGAPASAQAIEAAAA
jgi:hypothetical protein